MKELPKQLSQIISRRSFLGKAAALGAGAFAVSCGQSPGRKTDRVLLPSPESTNFPNIPTVLPTFTPEPIPTPEVISSSEAILDLGRAELALVGWEEIDTVDEVIFKNDPYEKGKIILIQAVAKNKSNSGFLLDETIGSSLSDYTFEIADYEGHFLGFGQFFTYLAYGGSIHEPFLKDELGRNRFLERIASTGPYYLGISPGYGLPVGIVADIPKESQKYGLVARPRHAGLPNPSGYREESVVIATDIIERGKIVKDMKLYPEGMEPADSSQIFSLRPLVGNGTIDYKLLGVSESQGADNVQQMLTFNVWNNTDREQFPFSLNIQRVLLTDGRVISVDKDSAKGVSIPAGVSLQYYLFVGSFSDEQNIELPVPMVRKMHEYNMDGALLYMAGLDTQSSSKEILWKIPSGPSVTQE